MEFIPVDKEIKQIVLNNLETPSQLQKELKKQGYRYVKIRRGGMVKYVMRSIKADKSKPKIEVKL